MDIFNFSEEYRNHKAFGKERYLRYGNLTSREYSFIEQHLVDIQVEYQLPCKDNVQVMVFTVEVDTLRSNELSDICGILSRASWRPSFFLLWHGDHGKFCTAIKELGKRGRGKVISQVSTRLFRLSAPDPWVYNVLNHLDVPFQMYTSDALIQEWYNAIDLVAGLHVTPLLEENGIVYKLDTRTVKTSAVSDDRGHSFFTRWYEDNLKDEYVDDFVEEYDTYINPDILIEDFSNAAQVCLYAYAQSRNDDSIYLEDDDVDDYMESEMNVDENLLMSSLNPFEVESWKHKYVIGCFRYARDCLNCLLPPDLLETVFISLQGEIRTWPEGQVEVIDIELLKLYVEHVYDDY